MAADACHRRRVLLNQEAYSYETVLRGSLLDTSNTWERIVASAAVPTPYAALVELKGAKYERQHAIVFVSLETAFHWGGRPPVVVRHKLER